MAKTLVFGGAGFIGSHLVRRLQFLDHDVIVYDDLSTGKRENIPSDVSFVRGDIRSDALSDILSGQEYIFNLAALVSVPLSFTQEQRCFDTNILGFQRILDATAKFPLKPKKVIFASSAAVYGDATSIPLSETTPRGIPSSPYAYSKFMGEFFANFYARNKGVPTVSLRFFNVYGRGQDPHSSYSGVVTRFIDQARRGESLTLFGDGTQTRDFVYVSDIVSALVLSMNLEGVYNVGTGVGSSIRNLAETIIQVTGSSSPIVYHDPRKGDILHSVSDITKIRSAGFTPRFSLKKGLEDLLL